MLSEQRTAHRLWSSFFLAGITALTITVGAVILHTQHPEFLPRSLAAANNLFTGIIQEPPGTPVTLSIPAIHVQAAVEQVGLDKDNAMATPTKWEDVGWYMLGPKPGEPGNAVMAGHLDSKTDMAVFWHLKDLKPGDTVTVTDDKGKERVFRVRELKEYKEDKAPIEEIFGNVSGTHLNLITCGGTWNKDAHQYDTRLVVFTDARETP
jgi:LPXTG-site transpeptidase (sortase) family protein